MHKLCQCVILLPLFVHTYDSFIPFYGFRCYAVEWFPFFNLFVLLCERKRSGGGDSKDFQALLVLVKSYWSATFMCLCMCLGMFICIFFCSQFVLFMQWILFSDNVGKLILHSISIPGIKKCQEQPIQHGFAYISGYNVYLHCFFSILCLQLFAFVYVLILILLVVQMKRSLLSRCEVNF